MITITNLKTGEKTTICRDVCTTHPAWVHEQCGASSESELQACLDGLNTEMWYDGDSHLGPDTAGIEMFHDESPFNMKKIVINLKDSEGKIEIEGEGCCRFQSNLKIEDESGECSEFNVAVDGLESLVLAHACAGVDVTSPKYVEGIETAYLAISQNLL